MSARKPKPTLPKNTTMLEALWKAVEARQSQTQPAEEPAAPTVNPHNHEALAQAITEATYGKIGNRIQPSWKDGQPVPYKIHGSRGFERTVPAPSPTTRGLPACIAPTASSSPTPATLTWIG